MESQQSMPQIASVVAFNTGQGLEIQATPLRLTPHSIAFEFYAPQSVLQLSEVLPDFRILAENHLLYTGKATVTSLVNAGAATVCEASLSSSLLDFDLFQLGKPHEFVGAAFESFLSRWQSFYKILPDYKLTVTDLHSFLHDLRLWLDQIELGIRAHPSGDRLQIEREMVEELIVACKIGRAHV